MAKTWFPVKMFPFSLPLTEPTRGIWCCLYERNDNAGWHWKVMSECGCISPYQFLTSWSRRKNCPVPLPQPSLLTKCRLRRVCLSRPWRLNTLKQPKVTSRPSISCRTPSIQIKDWKISSDPSQNIHTHINNIQTYPLTYSKEQSIDINVIHV